MAKKDNTKEKEHIELMWLEGVRLDTEDSGWAQKYSYVASSSTKRYYNCLYLLCRLSPCARNLMDYLSEEMTEDNMISTDKFMRDSFDAFISRITNKRVSYKDISIKKAVRELKDKHLLITVGIGRAKVNPMYFFKGSDSKRIENIKLIIKIGSKMPDNAFKWHSQESILDSKLITHKKSANKIGSVINKDELEEMIKSGIVEKQINL